MSSIRKNFLAAAALVTAGLLSTTVNAASEDFAQTRLSDTSGANDFAFTNNGTSATFSTIPGGAPAIFDYIPADISGTLPLSLTGDLPIHIVLSSTTSTAGASIFSGAIDIQPIDSGTAQFLLNTPVNGHSNLLTVTFTNATISGFDGPSSPASFDVQDGNASGTASYTSDFLTFGGTTTGNNYSNSLATTNPGLAFTNSFLDSFGTNGLSTASYDNSNSSVTASVPEPTSLGLLSAGSLLLLRRRRANDSIR